MLLTSLNPTNSDFQVPLFTELAIQTNEESQQHFLNRMSKVQIPFYCIASLLDLSTLMQTGYAIAWFQLICAILGIALTILCVRLSCSLTTVRLGSWIIVAYTIFNIAVNTFSSGTLLPVVGISIFPLILSLFLLPGWATVGFTLISIGICFTLYIVELLGYRAPLLQNATSEAIHAMVLWLIVIPAPVLVSSHIVKQIKQNLSLSLKQNQQLKEALKIIEEKRHFSQTAGEQLNSVIVELNAAATQQASGSHQQAAAITQSISSLEELAQTAREIALKADNIDELSKQVLALSEGVKDSVERVNLTGERGQRSVERTLDRNRQVSQLYITLVESFNNLQNQSVQIKGITELIHHISTETHLLSLNATLEAAGAGSYGERFGVVAQEVKKLADRSSDASREIGQILGLVENGIKKSVQVVKDGQNETEQALKLSVESGEIIRELAVAVNSSSEEMTKIAELIKPMSELTGVINFASNQQFSASKQSAEVLANLGIVAQQSATASIQLTRTANYLEELAQGLTESLNA